MMANRIRVPLLRAKQGGMISVVAILFLITAVIFVLSQTLNITSTTSVDNLRQLEGVKALFAAESGLERAQSLLASGTCSSLAGVTGTAGAGASYTLSVDPQVCQGLICTCTFRSTGTFTGTSGASRTLQLSAEQSRNYGISGGGTTSASFTLLNGFSVPAIGIFNNAMYGGPGATGASIAINSCALGGVTACPSSYLDWSTESSSGGSDAVDDMGVSLSIAANGNQTATFGYNRTANWSIVGGLLPSVNATPPTVLSSYWKDNGTDGVRTTYGRTVPATSTGRVNNGTVFGNTTCDLGGSGAEQSCKNWCTGGDTLVFGVAALSESLSNISNVVFNTNNTANALTLSSLVSYPVTASPATMTGGGVYSKLYYAFNANFPEVTAGNFVVGMTYVIKTVGSTTFTSIGATSNAAGTVFTATGVGSGTGVAIPLYTNNASVYKGRGTAAIGASWTGGSGTACSISRTGLQVTGHSGGNCIDNTLTGSIGSSGVSLTGTTLSVTGSPGTPIYPGARITKTGSALTGTVYVVRQLSSTESGGALFGSGTYEVSVSQSGTVSGGNWNAANSLLSMADSSATGLYPAQLLSAAIISAPGTLPQVFNATAGDLVSSSGGTGNVTNAKVAAQLYSAQTGGVATGSGGAGVYSLINDGTPVTVAASNTRTWTATSNVLNVSGCTICFIEAGDAVSGLITGAIASQINPNTGRSGELLNGVGRYLLSSSASLPSYVASSASLKVGDPAAGKVYLPASSSPLVSGQRFAVWSATSNQYAGNVSGVNASSATTGTRSFNVTPTPPTTLDLQPICVGTCAFFDAPASSSSTTDFSVASTNTNRWAGGFVCARGVDGANISPIVQPGPFSRKAWREPVN